MRINRWVGKGLAILTLVLIGLYLLSSQAKADIVLRTPELQMNLEKISADPVPLWFN